MKVWSRNGVAMRCLQLEWWVAVWTEQGDTTVLNAPELARSATRPCLASNQKFIPTNGRSSTDITLSINLSLHFILSTSHWHQTSQNRLFQCVFDKHFINELSFQLAWIILDFGFAFLGEIDVDKIKFQRSVGYWYSNLLIVLIGVFENELVILNSIQDHCVAIIAVKPEFRSFYWRN